MKKIVSLLTVFIMALTIVAIPTVDNSYAETDENSEIVVFTEEITDETYVDGSDETTEEPEEDADLEPVIHNISEAKINLEKQTYVFSGKAFTPKVVVSHNGKTLKKDTDYKVSYSNNIKAGTAKVTIKGIGVYKNSTYKTFKITPKSLSGASVKISYSNYGYKKSDRKPVPTVKLNGKTLKKGVDYKVTYTNNRYPGTAKVKVTGIGNYKGTLSKSFYIAKMGSLSLKSRGTSSLKLGWSPKENVTGYQIYKYSTSEDKWVWAKTVKGASAKTATVTGLKEGYSYKFKIRAYVKDSKGNAHFGSFGPVISTTTKPGKVSISKLSTNIKMQLIVKWKKERGNGYQVYVSRNANFKDPSVYTIKSSSTLSKTIQAGKNNKTYYVKVRAYKVINGKTVYGAWSSTKKIKVDGTGWGTIDGRKYYCKNGKPVKGNKVIDGNHYFFGRNSGALMGVNHKMYNKVKDEKSGTKYLIAVSRTKNRLCIYEKSKGEWVVKYYWKCSTGAPGLISPISKTPAGYYNVPKKTTHKLHFGEESGYTCWYATRIKKGYYFHSVLYNPRSKTSIQDGRLGYNVSHGCVRLALKNAKWMYENIDAGTRIVIMN